MSTDPVARVLRFPPPSLSTTKIPKTRQPSSNWFRVHLSRCSAAHFSLNVGHRYSHKDCPHPVLYLAVDIHTCLFERFGDLVYDHQRTIAQSLWSAHSASTLRVPELLVCDLTHARTLSALMVDLSALMHSQIVAPQAWGLAIQLHPAGFQAIKFKSRFNGKACLALFQRDGVEKQLREKALGPLPEHDAAADWLDKHNVSLY